MANLLVPENKKLELIGQDYESFHKWDLKREEPWLPQYRVFLIARRVVEPSFMIPLVLQVFFGVMYGSRLGDEDRDTEVSSDGGVCNISVAPVSVQRLADPVGTGTLTALRTHTAHTITTTAPITTATLGRIGAVWLGPRDRVL